MEKLSQGFKRKLIEALRSGKYKQCIGQLRMDDPRTEEGYSYCVLGLVAHLSGCKFKDNGSGAALCKDDIIGINKVPCTLKDDSEEAETIMSMNDRGVTFPELADFIEENM